MKQRKMIAVVLALLLLCMAGLAACGGSGTDIGSSGAADAGASGSGADTGDADGESATDALAVTDLAGRTVTLPAPPEKALAIAGPSYEKVFLLGQADRLAGAHFLMVERPWVIATNPNIAGVAAIESPGEPNVETLLSLEPDVALFFDYEEPLAAMTDAGIPVVVVQNSSGNPKTADEFIDYQKKEVQVFADTFGGAAQEKAKEWMAYFDEKVAYVQGKVSGIPEADRKTALYAYGDEGLGVFSQYSYVSFWLELAGGKNLADETGQEMDTLVTMEQVVAWDPDFYFLGRMENGDSILGDEKWAGLSAIQNGNVHVCPDGVMFWDYSSEGVLLMEFLAQKMYPELFADLDMVGETQAYYSKFYNYDLSAEDAQRLLDHLPPAGA